MNVSALMSRHLHTCTTNDRLSDAVRIMWEHDCGFVPVLDDEGRLVGVITDRDACMAAFFQGRNLADVHVAGPMAKWVVTCRAADPVATAAELMRFHRVRRLPVLDARDRLVGVLSVSDLAREAACDREVAEVLSALADVGHTDTDVRRVSDRGGARSAAAKATPARLHFDVVLGSGAAAGRVRPRRSAAAGRR